MLYYEEFGNAENPTVVLLPGADMAPTFALQYPALIGKYHLVLVHILGTGKSSGRLWSLQENMDGILEIIKALGKNQVTLCGFSMGAQLTVALVCKAPELFRKAVIVSAWLIKPPKETKRMVNLMEVIFPLGTWTHLLKKQAKMLRLDEAQTEEYIRAAKGSRRENIKRYSYDGVELAKLPEFADVKIPMLALCGEKEDRVMMVPSTKRLGEMNPHCRTMILPNHAHDIPYKNPEEFTRILLNFLEET